MGFLREQLGEDELRALLDRLNAWTEVIRACAPCLNVAQCVLWLSWQCRRAVIMV